MIGFGCNFTALFYSRKKCSLLAIHNAKEKAKEMARFVHLIVGRPLYIGETEIRESETVKTDETTDPDDFMTIQNKIASATINIVSHVVMCFELKPKGKGKIVP